MVEMGRISAAAHLLEEGSASVQPTPEVVNTLKAKHPAGPANPFGSGVGPVNGSCPDTEALQSALKSFKVDTAPGVSGWTVPLLRAAMRSKVVMEMIHSLCTMMVSGTAPGQEMLCSSRLVALAKPGGGIRPIAVGELLYRLCTKAILRHSLKPDFLLGNQFGVGSKGGVEPVVHAVNTALDNHKFTHLTSLDFTNAFNSVGRQLVAQAVRKYSPVLYRLAKWAYNKPTDLVLPGVPPLHSSQGVRQGDPLGPLLFSVGIRPLLEDLIVALGPECTVLAYLDDIYVLSSSDSTLSEVESFFASQQDLTLSLNMAKSSIKSLSDIRDNGLGILGSTVGPRSARESFLKDKIAMTKAKLGKLVDLPHQHALLLLLQAVQQDLRHLQRTLKSEDLMELWEDLDMALWDKARSIRGAARVMDPEKDNTLLSLPVKLGGLGLLSHSTCAPLAYVASTGAASVILHPLLGDPGPDPPEPPSQHSLCLDAFKSAQADLTLALPPLQQQALVENSSALGRQWLSAIPSSAILRLTNFEVAAALQLRTMVPSTSPSCRHCGHGNFHGHDEVCPHKSKWTVARHEQVKKVIAGTLNIIPDIEVHLEPFISDTTHRRNDIRVSGSHASGLANHEYDISIVSLGSVQARTTVCPPGFTGSTLERASATVHKFLDSVSREKFRNLPSSAATPFTPLIFSLGGVMEHRTAQALHTWGEVLPPHSHRMLCIRLSLTLLRARVRNFDLWSH
jgi:hypothetical protein